MASKKPILKQKTKKKKWFPIYAPAVFGSKLIGESHVENSDLLQGKHINMNLSTITGDMKKQNVMVKLRVNKVADGQGQTEVIGMHLVQSFLKRLVRRGRTKVEDSFTTKSKDGQFVRIKPLVITTTNCVSSTASDIRRETKQWLKQHLKETGFVNMVDEILTFKVQKALKDHLKKVHPIRSVDIRAFKREPIRGKVPEAELDMLPEEEAEQEKAEEAAKEESEEQPSEEAKEETAEDEEKKESSTKA
ncbi:MAG: hypothetical protein ACLFO2_05015 [Candidatus Woesearchaeota archaeon]